MRGSRFVQSAIGIAVWATLTASLVGCGASASNNSSAGAGDHPMQWSSAPTMQIDVHKQYNALFHTNYGDFTVQLFPTDSPHTVNNFVFLAKQHFYDGDKFFRIVRTFMVQTGDPKNNGTGGPGYTFADELPPRQSYSPGILAMANRGPDTNGSQFFICTGPDAQRILDSQPNYTQFGKVVSGMDVVQKIAAMPVTYSPAMQETSMPTNDAHIESIDIVVK